MFDGLTNSADGLFILLYVITLVVFFLFGPHKVYESLFWALLGLGLYLFIHELTFVFPEITRTVFFWNWLVDNRGTLLWLAKWSTLVLFFVTPITLGLNVSGVVRGTFWFFFKTIVLSAFFVSFGAVLFSLLSNGAGVFGEVTLLPRPLTEYVYFQNSQFFTWLAGKTAAVLLFSFLLAFYKIIFSHWISRMFLVGGLLYAKSNDLFTKKSLDSVIPHEMSHDDGGHSDDHH
jgi:hypothetical protein